MSPLRRIIVSWARVQAWADGSASVSIVPVVPMDRGPGGDRIVVVQCVIGGKIRHATLRLPRGPVDLHRVAAWAEHLEERASRVRLAQLVLMGSREPSVVLH